jgi:hypothetical protein
MMVRSSSLVALCRDELLAAYACLLAEINELCKCSTTA